ncbi:hypothetical protein L2E82_22481 [Cichorium intybus]|uniref:Uncharacterized protein n=1 Tax=Cichorium intybus TaxID=13427 RepID=A0ACB9DXW0_CICIN|nr:hypothetical protein L2E82_22481 [Cichorium intybus]
MSSSTTPLSRWRTKVKRMKTADWIDFFLPCSRWIRTYNWRENLQPDVIAGVTVGVMHACSSDASSMSYAKLAGLQSIYGLYTGLVPVFVYSIFGSSRQLAVGPVALVSTELAILLSPMVGILECTMGLLRLGWLIRFISHSVISGFTTSSAFVIGLSQAKYYLGYDVSRRENKEEFAVSESRWEIYLKDLIPPFSIPKEFGQFNSSTKRVVSRIRLKRHSDSYSEPEQRSTFDSSKIGIDRTDSYSSLPPTCAKFKQCTSEISPDKNSKFLERLGTRRKEDLSTSEMESGERDKDSDPQLEPLLSRKSH